MHTIRETSPNRWSIGYWHPRTQEWNEIDYHANKDSAMQWCSYLNGGLHPLGYTMDVRNHY